LYELLTYQKPFTGENVHAVLHKVVTAEPAPLQHTDSSVPVPDELQATISGALAKDVAARFASADAMIEALQGARKALGEQDSPAYRGPSWSGVIRWHARPRVSRRWDGRPTRSSAWPSRPRTGRRPGRK